MKELCFFCTNTLRQPSPSGGSNLNSLRQLYNKAKKPLKNGHIFIFGLLPHEFSPNNFIGTVFLFVLNCLFVRFMLTFGILLWKKVCLTLQLKFQECLKGF